MFEDGGDSAVAERTQVKPAARPAPAPDAGLLPEAVRNAIGTTKRRRCLATARDIRRFAQAIGEPLPPPGTPDEEQALVAPPLFCQTLSYDELPVELLPPDGSPAELDVPVPARRLVGGASELQLHRRVRAGELLDVETTLADVQLKKGRSGTLYLLVIETRVSDAQGQPVSVETATYVKRP